MLITQRLAGARNVTSVANRREAQTDIEEFDASLAVLLQEQLDPQDFTEMTVDLDISALHIRTNKANSSTGFALFLWVSARFRRPSTT